ncbi:AbrB/MazE/SpoVT family DNA-binding domain-containing protein [Candidatus Gottesmanbacteria bacterium]|nr:AbrB/MazE/SpoVT family DNA-binding domain-containing protein [Candidatus Gottesmanbacteria bacterium]
MTQKIIRAGHSLAVVIPSRVTRVMGIKAGDKVNLFAKPEKGRITLTFQGTLQLPLTLTKKQLS